MKKALPLVLLLLAVGCGTRLNMEKTVQLANIEPKVYKVEPIAKEQTINVSAKTADGAFSIFVFLEKDQNAAESGISQGKPGDKVLAHELKKTEADLHATIPANETAVVYLVSADGKKAEVKLKISN